MSKILMKTFYSIFRGVRTPKTILTTHINYKYEIKNKKKCVCFSVYARQM